MTSSKPVRAPRSIFTALSFVILAIVGLSAGGLFLYKNYLIKQEDVLSTSLGHVRDSFDKDTIDELELYDKRSSAAEAILSKHLVLSPMFELLGNLTIPSVQYVTFDHQTTAEGFIVHLSGTAPDYKSIALQADAFNSTKGRLFKNVIFSNINRDKVNNVTFDVTFMADPSLLSYQKNFLLNQIQSKINNTQAAPAQTTNTPTDQGTTPVNNNQPQ